MTSQTPSPSEQSQGSLMPQQGLSPSACGCGENGEQLVFSIGSLYIDCGTDAIEDSLRFYMRGIHDDEGEIIE